MPSKEYEVWEFSNAPEYAPSNGVVSITVCGSKEDAEQYAASGRAAWTTPAMLRDAVFLHTFGVSKKPKSSKRGKAASTWYPGHVEYRVQWTDPHDNSVVTSEMVFASEKKADDYAIDRLGLDRHPTISGYLVVRYQQHTRKGKRN